MSAPMLPWQENILFLSVIYAMLEQGEKFQQPLEGDDTFLEPILDDMYQKGLLELTPKGEYRVSKNGEGLRGRMVAMYDQLLKFDVFGTVNLELQLTEEQSPDGKSVYDNILDPTFSPSPKSQDVRLAMLDWYGSAAAEKLGGKKVDPHQIVFMQRLRAGHYKGDDFWFNLRVGKVFQDIDAIVTTAIKWQDLGANPEESSDVMGAMYAAGMAEQIKRDGERCSCGAYLGMYDYYARGDGETVTKCPVCDGSFSPPPDATESCPNCGSDIHPGQRKCRGCRATIDRSMAAGTVETTTTETYETYYGSYDPWGMSYVDYGYIAPAPIYPGIWVDPYEPWANVVTFGLLCALL